MIRDSLLEVAGTSHFQGVSTFDNNITAAGNISGSSTSTGSFGLVLQNGNELSTFLGDRGTETLFSGSRAFNWFIRKTIR